MLQAKQISGGQTDEDEATNAGAEKLKDENPRADDATPRRGSEEDAREEEARGMNGVELRGCDEDGGGL